MNDRFLYWHFRSALAWSLAVVAFAYFALTAGGFLRVGNIFALMQSFALLLLVGAGLTVVMLMGQFDLSITALFPLSGLVSVKVADVHGPFVGILIGLSLGLMIGALNGLLTALFDIPSLAVTIGTMVLAIGLGYLISAGSLVYAKDYQTGLRLTEPIAGVLSFQSIVELGVVLVIGIALAMTWLGRFVYAVGSDAARARASGIPVAWMLVIGFVVSGFCTSLGGSLQSTALATGQAGTNDSFLLQAATAAVLGGVALTGGRGNLVGVVGAALLLATLGNGLSLVGADSASVQLVNGVILLLVVLLHDPLTRLATTRPRPAPTVRLDRTSFTIRKEEQDAQRS